MDKDVKEFASKMYNSIEEYANEIQNKLELEKNKNKEEIQNARLTIFPEGEFNDAGADFFKRIGDSIKNWKFRRKIKEITKKENEYDQLLFKLTEIQKKWNLEKTNYEKEFLKKFKVINKKLEHIEIDWIKRIEMKNKEIYPLRELNPPLVLMIDDEQIYTLENVKEGLFKDPIYGNYHILDPKKMRSWKIGGDKYNTYIIHAKSLLPYPVMPMYDASTVTAHITEMMAQIEKTKDLNKNIKVEKWFLYIGIAIAAIIGIVILFNYILPAIFPNMAKAAAPVVANVDANTMPIGASIGLIKSIKI